MSDTPDKPCVHEWKFIQAMLEEIIGTDVHQTDQVQNHYAYTIRDNLRDAQWVRAAKYGYKKPEGSKS